MLLGDGDCSGVESDDHDDDNDDDGRRKPLGDQLVSPQVTSSVRVLLHIGQAVRAMRTANDNDNERTVSAAMCWCPCRCRISTHDGRPSVSIMTRACNTYNTLWLCVALGSATTTANEVVELLGDYFIICHDGYRVRKRDSREYCAYCGPCFSQACVGISAVCG